MTKDVMVSISGLQIEGGEGGETVEVISNGEYYYRDGAHFVIYNEISEENSQECDTRCVLKMTPSQIDLMKKGTITTRMCFEKGKTHMGQYSTQFGEIRIGTTTNSIKLQENDNSLLAELVYSLDVNSEFVSECHLTVKVTN